MSWFFVLSPPRAPQTSHYKTESTRGEVEMGQARWPFLSRRGPEAGSEGGLSPGQDMTSEGSVWSPEEASSIRWP